ncbi:hypothetical protein FE697_015325 [Mumia zhuanghuii]|uniref:Lsr2 protein n=2 Tax=Mumia TaxID=1546255 RepID=A0ABW1QQ00_9ACTN|nr:MULTISPECIES: hypothetical protein [Mumia]KAA1422503.1 hypothetical protein FE697_015325 [Mumia zhuanghuii]
MARLREPERPPVTSQALPKALAVGCLVEVWEAPHGITAGALAAFRRFRIAASHWHNTHGVAATHSSPWTLEYLTYRGQAERSGRSVEELVAERLGRYGVAVADIPALREEAEELVRAAGPAHDPRRPR